MKGVDHDPSIPQAFPPPPPAWQALRGNQISYQSFTAQLGHQQTMKMPPYVWGEASKGSTRWTYFQSS
jgi:hypothetical protein